MSIFEHIKVWRYMNGGFWGNLCASPEVAAKQYFDNHSESDKIDVGAGWYNGVMYSTANEPHIIFDRSLNIINNND